MEDQSKKKELSEAAKALREDPAFNAAILALRQRWFGQLMLDAGNTLQEAELCSRLRALEAIPAELGTLMNDYRMAARKANG